MEKKKLQSVSIAALIVSILPLAVIEIYLLLNVLIVLMLMLKVLV